MPRSRYMDDHQHCEYVVVEKMSSMQTLKLISRNKNERAIARIWQFTLHCYRQKGGYRTPRITVVSDAQLDEKGRVFVRSTLQLLEHDNVFCAGDCAFVKNSQVNHVYTFFSAIESGRVAAQNVCALIAVSKKHVALNLFEYPSNGTSWNEKTCCAAAQHGHACACLQETNVEIAKLSTMEYTRDSSQFRSVLEVQSFPLASWSSLGISQYGSSGFWSVLRCFPWSDRTGLCDWCSRCACISYTSYLPRLRIWSREAVHVDFPCLF